MSKAPTLSPIANISTGGPVINANNGRIEESFQNTLSRDGSTPNQMEADFDLNGYDLLNARNIDAEDITLNGESLQTYVDAAEQAAIEAGGFRDEAELIVGSISDVAARRSVETFVGTGVLTTFTLGEAPVNKDFTQVYIDGVYQNKDGYEIGGFNIVFSEAPPLDSVIEVNSLEQSVVGTLNSSYVGYGVSNVQEALDVLFSEEGQILNYTTRQLLADDLANLADGDVVFVRGVPYVIDSTATGFDSALQDLGVDGVRRTDNLSNLFLSVNFTNQNDTTISISASLDGINFKQINDAVLPGGPDYALSQRDPSITYFNGYWWVFGTGNAAGSHDFVLFRSKDLTSWTKHQIAMQGGPYASNTTPMPGGTVAATPIWAPEPFIEDGVLNVMISIRFADDFVGVYGTNQFHFRPYYTICTDPDNLVFSAPIGMDFPAAYPPNVRQWSGSANVAPTTPLMHTLPLPTNKNAGFETTFMEKVARDYPNDTILFVPAGKGGSGFANGEWISGGASRTTFTNRLNDALAANPGAVIEGLLWHQGEADRDNVNYESDLASFFSYVRSTWPTFTTAPLVLGEIGTFVTPGVTDVNAVSASVAASFTNGALVSSTGLTDKGDSLHFDTNSYRTLGDRYYTAWRSRRGTLPVTTGVVRIFVIAGQSNSVGSDFSYMSYDENLSLIDASVVKADGVYYCAIKDDAYKNIRIYSAPALSGPWKFSQTLMDAKRSIEAPCLTRVRDFAVLGSDARRDKWRVYVDNNRTGPDDTSPDVLVGAPFYFETVGIPTNDYGSMAKVHYARAVRHGSIVNLSELPPEATLSLATLSVAGGAKRSNTTSDVVLPNGTAFITPQEGYVYAVGGTDSCTLTVRDGPADSFFLSVASGQASCGMKVLGTQNNPRTFIIGYGDSNDTLIEMKRRGNSGFYYPIGQFRRGEVRADRLGVSQTISAGTDTLLVLTNEAFDNGDYFNTETNRWTPPRGKVYITAQACINNAETNGSFRVHILKNGNPVSTAYSNGGGLSTAVAFLLGDEASGTDYYQVQLRASGTGTREINGNSNLTFMHGVSR